MKNSQKIEKCHKMMFKMLVNGYARSRCQNQLIEDCYSATSLQIETMAERVHHELQIIQEIVDGTPVPNQMSVIVEQSTDRQDNEYGRQTERVKELFNSKLFAFKKIQNNLDQMLTLYKSQLKCMAQEVTEFKSKNKKLKAALDMQKKRNQEFESQLSDLEISQTRKPPLPFQQEILRQPEVCSQCQNKENRQMSANIDDKGKWKTLSNKIDKLRKKIENTQQELQNKDKEIYALTSRLSKTKDYDSELKKSKQQSTTLRGEKITLQTKLSNLKKELADKEEAIQLQIKENRKLRIEIDNISSTNRWQNNVINDLKQTLSKIRVGKEVSTTAQVEQTQRFQRQKSALIQFMHQQEDLLVKMNHKLKELQHQTQSELLQSKQQMQQLQDILDEKNETIIKLKSKGAFNGKGEDHEKMPYYQELIRVLTRKVADRDQMINQLKNPPLIFNN